MIQTDRTAIISNSVTKFYLDAGLKFYRIQVYLKNRTPHICRQIAKEDKHYELSEMKAGLNAPPFHYTCWPGIVPDDKELSSSIVPRSGKILELESDKAYNQYMIVLYLMAKQSSFTVATDIRVRAKKLRGTEFDFWVQDNTKKIRDTVAYIQAVFNDLDGYVKPTVVFLKKSRLPGYAGYDYRQDILFVSDVLSSNEEFSRLLLDNYFAARDIRETMIHELTHKQHWDSAKAFYKANKKRYNNVEQAMSELNSPSVSYIKEQQKSDYNYLYGISDNAAIAFYENNVNELVAEVEVLGDRVPDSILLNKVKEVLSWK